MVVGIDYRLAASSHRGMGRYAREIVRKLFALDTQNCYILYIDTPCQETLPSNFRWHCLPAAGYILGEQIYLSRAVKHDKVDVLWSTSNTFPLWLPRRVKLIVTIHDLIFMYPLPRGQNFVQRIGALYRRVVVKCGIKRVDKVVTVSQFSADELKRIFKIDKATITYNCIESFYNLSRNTEKVIVDNKNNNTQSAEAPSKNIDFLLRSFAEKLPLKNLIVGGIKTDSPLREKYLPFKNILFLDNGISDSLLIGYYKGCQAFIYVSLMEGFGIPPLEALACGAKVICSNATSLPEVVGQQGLLIDPTNQSELLKAIEKIETFETEKSLTEQHLQKFVDWERPAKIIKNLITQ
ncbi:MAG: glycosyltransferase family 1 protein [Mucinivorans sp.]